MAKEIIIILSKSEQYDGLSIADAENVFIANSGQKLYEDFYNSGTADHQDFSTYDESVHGGFTFINYYYCLAKYLSEEIYYSDMKNNASYTTEGNIKLKYYFHHLEHYDVALQYLQSFTTRISESGLTVISSETVDVADIA
jgi:hypothetical protein